MNLIPINAPRCCGSCAQGRNDACDCGVGAPSAVDMERVRRTARAIFGPYRRPSLFARFCDWLNKLAGL